MNKAQFHQQVFLELLRYYHNGIGVSHGADPQHIVAQNLTNEANVIVEHYYKSLGERQT